jgi:hypothetical protein
MNKNPIEINSICVEGVVTYNFALHLRARDRTT